MRAWGTGGWGVARSPPVSAACLSWRDGVPGCELAVAPMIRCLLGGGVRNGGPSPEGSEGTQAGGEKTGPGQQTMPGVGLQGWALSGQQPLAPPRMPEVGS